ncbi:MAG: hypothetical protein EOO29_39435, partial [Comamonadaceae bacterium]
MHSFPLHTTRRLLGALALAGTAAGLLLPGAALAETWPAKPIKVIGLIGDGSAMYSIQALWS